MEAVQSTNSADQATSQPASQNLKALLSQARGTREMLQQFKAAIDDCTVHGSHVYALALGVQFLNTLLSQAKGDIEALQQRIASDAKASDPINEADKSTKSPVQEAEKVS